MGGSAFSAGAAPLFTPRMLPHVYRREKQRCQALLRQLYVHVDSPIDGPGKKDFGDIDILVFGRRPEAPPPPTEPNTKPSTSLIREIATLLGAERTILCDAGASSNLAIPWPKDDDPPQEQTHDDINGISDTKDSTPKYIQVDVRVSPSLESHRWMLFKHAHGDIWNLIGSLVRPYGLTIDDTGMWLRIPEVEAVYKSRAKVHLTSDPDRVLSFLGLPFTGAHARVWTDEAFPDLDAMFEYVTRCRMMYITPSATGPPDQSNHDEGHNLLKDVQNLKHNDRKRMQHRPGFKMWIEEFIPRCRREGRFTAQTTDRGRITEEALKEFGDGVRGEFERRRRDFLLERQRDFIWNGIIKVLIPDVPLGETDQVIIMRRACLVKGLKRIILERDASYGVEFDEDMVNQDGSYNEDRVRNFIREYKDQVQEAAIGRQTAAFIENKEKKRLAKEAKAARDAKKARGESH